MSMVHDISLVRLKGMSCSSASSQISLIHIIHSPLFCVHWSINEITGSISLCVIRCWLQACTLHPHPPFSLGLGMGSGLFLMIRSWQVTTSKVRSGTMFLMRSWQVMRSEARLGCRTLLQLTEQLSNCECWYREWNTLSQISLIQWEGKGEIIHDSVRQRTTVSTV